MNFLKVEMQRAVHRSVVRVLILIALLGCVAAGVIAFTSSMGSSIAELQAKGEHHPAVIRDWWIAGGGDGALPIGSFFLLLGGLIGGATVAGAEWRAGTITTLLTWEPRRVRMHLRTAACALLAFAISFVLQIVFLASFLPATLANGSTANVDAAWWVSLVAAMARTSLLTAIGASLGVALATLGRNAAFALVATFAWITIIEGMIRGLKPGLARFLWGENMTVVLTWAQLENVSFRRGPLLALVTVTLYVSVIVAAATFVFRRRERRECVVMQHLKTMAALLIGISVFATGLGLGLTLAFGLLAFIGMPILVIGLGLLSAAIDDIE